MFSASTALCTCAREGLLATLTVSSVPLAKSMPSAKCRVAMETMPGMMMISERAKNRLRRPMMLRRRIRGAGAGAATAWAGSGSEAPSGTMSALCCSALMSDSSDTVHPEQARAPETAARKHDREEVVGHDDAEDERSENNVRHADRNSLDI